MLASYSVVDPTKMPRASPYPRRNTTTKPKKARPSLTPAVIVYPLPDGTTHSQSYDRADLPHSCPVMTTFRTSRTWRTMSVIEGKADFPVARPDFSVLTQSGLRLLNS